MHLLTPLQVGRHESRKGLLFAAVMGLQNREHSLSLEFSSCMANADAQNELMKSHVAMSQEDQVSIRNKVDKKLAEELDADRHMLSVSLGLAVFIASISQFLVG